jgi:hypothetical protein
MKLEIVLGMRYEKVPTATASEGMPAAEGRS